MTRKNSYDLEAVMDILDALIGPEGCPWDKEQTAVSLCDYVIEEAHELTEAIRSGDTPGVREELGDVLFLLCFLIRLFENAGAMEFREIMGEIAAKMIRRHPHVFENETKLNKSEIWSNWEKIKKREKKSYSVLGGIPKSLPPLLKAYRIHAKAARAGFSWHEEGDVLGQMREVWKEFEQAKETGDKGAQKEEFGDYLFTLVEYGRRAGIKCEEALEYANLKFIRRFAAMEKMLNERQLEMQNLSPDELDILWSDCKTS